MGVCLALCNLITCLDRSQVPHWGQSDGQVLDDFKTNANQNLKPLGIKGHSNKVQRQPTEWVKILANCISQRG